MHQILVRYTRISRKVKTVRAYFELVISIFMMVKWLAQFTDDQVVLGSIRAIQFFSREPAVLKCVRCQHTQKTNGDENINMS